MATVLIYIFAGRVIFTVRSPCSTRLEQPLIGVALYFVHAQFGKFENPWWFNDLLTLSWLWLQPWSNFFLEDVLIRLILSVSSYVMLCSFGSKLRVSFVGILVSKLTRSEHVNGVASKLFWLPSCKPTKFRHLPRINRWIILPSVTAKQTNNSTNLNIFKKRNKTLYLGIMDSLV